MSYKIDGSSHRNGIEGEWKVLKFLNNKENFEFIASSINKVNDTKRNFLDFNFIQKGGTQNRVDIQCLSNNIGISIKSKKKSNGKYKGTFDLINTSNFNNLCFDNHLFKNAIKEWDEWVGILSSTQKGGFSYYEIESHTKVLINRILNNMNHHQIENVFQKIALMEIDVIDIIRNYKETTLEEVSPSDLCFLKKNWYTIESETFSDHTIINPTNKSSAFIKNKDNSDSVFRIRISLNNGVRALMRATGIEEKIQGKNNSSVLALKIQVDKVQQIITCYDVNFNNNETKITKRLKL